MLRVVLPVLKHSARGRGPSIGRASSALGDSSAGFLHILTETLDCAAGGGKKSNGRCCKKNNDFFHKCSRGRP